MAKIKPQVVTHTTTSKADKTQVILSAKEFFAQKSPNTLVAMKKAGSHTTSYWIGPKEYFYSLKELKEFAKQEQFAKIIVVDKDGDTLREYVVK